MWNIWKERNQRVFNDQSMSIEQIWTILHQNIKETLSIKAWSQEDFPSLPQEQSVWANWKIHLNQKPTLKDNPTKSKQRPAKWTLPPSNMFQLNFDGASKGNPGKEGFGGVFRDHYGIPQLIFLGSKGWDSNNSAELEGLWRGLTLAQDKSFFPLIIEGDSQIIINMVTKLMQGSPIHKVSSSWRMAQRLELIDKWLSQHQAISFKHTKREGNKLVDFLANIGVKIGVDLFVGSISNIASEVQLSDFHNIVKDDMI